MDCCARTRCFSGSARAARRPSQSERECRESVGFTDQRTYDESQLQEILGAQGYTAGIRYGGTYGVNPLQCLQGLKDLLIDNGMQVFESTEMDRLEDHTAYTHAGSVTADNIIVAVDKLTNSISPLADETFHAQTFLSVTEPLTDRELRDPVSVRRADAVLGLQARVFVFQADGGQSSAARRRHARHDIPQGRVQ